MNRAQKHWVAVFAWMAFIFVMSTDVGSSVHSSSLISPFVLWANPNATPEQFEFVHFLFRKAGHLTEYSVLGILILRALRSSQREGLPLSVPTAAAITLAIAASYAATDEFHYRPTGIPKIRQKKAVRLRGLCLL